ncbi:hypothetical protein HMPREF3034_00332 [Prevotella sp. DNF00663]|uniref:hypothetical protein n=1 Tax=Prevotella sp. DNF00663 TaxID=1384078 RepID=UPI0007839BED|nr:hypothetical protein [Prevotella sp. DNF00663]KXB85151.1 hypothetical protein HMPREF3034_00332 [Prevotella sp. DNF00663]
MTSPTEQTHLQLERFLNKIAHKLSPCETPTMMTDIHIKVSQDSGEMLALDDSDVEITRCVVEEWIDNKDDNFYQCVTKILRDFLHKNADIANNLGLLKPYSFVLEDDENENIAELYVADDDTIIIGGDLMSGLDDDLDNFFNDLINK